MPDPKLTTETKGELENQMNPTSDEQLDALIGIFEVATTDGEIQLDTNQIGNVYLWLLWAQNVLRRYNEELQKAQQQDDAPRFNELSHIFGLLTKEAL